MKSSSFICLSEALSKGSFLSGWSGDRKARVSLPGAPLQGNFHPELIDPGP